MRNLFFVIITLTFNILLFFKITLLFNTFGLENYYNVISLRLENVLLKNIDIENIYTPKIFKTFYEVGNHFEYFYSEGSVWIRTYRFVERDSVINGIKYKVVKEQNPMHGTNYMLYYFDKKLRLMRRAEECEKADSNGNIMEIGFNFPLGYTWMKCSDFLSQIVVTQKGMLDSVIGDPTFQRYVDTKNELSLFPEERRYVVKFGLYKRYIPSLDILEVLVGAVVDGIVYGSVTLSGTSHKKNTTNEIELFQNYPNPFNSRTVIKFYTSINQPINIIIFNNLGREMKRLNRLYYDAGIHEIIIDGVNLASGIYYYRIEAGDFMDTKKMILLK